MWISFPPHNGDPDVIHRQLKASLMCHTDSTWFEAFPVVLLGIRSVFKKDLQSSSSELVYGEPPYVSQRGNFLFPLSSPREVNQGF
ncbi:hypothetical protein TNIN_423431 [Trichonephila inaurata madagascariensis]|uniref:Uncharacterized protein n=1 Tax=Trichonephila inaurata madagascariensis TaxID=2747483 RepID=A0A8X6WSS7_9ARAC|nr:hypothetical protein TNIN_423431 [Trichonephila inaurata madagascariensis]